MKDIEKFVFIVGWPRTGHTLIRDILNLHSNMMFGSEGYDVLKVIPNKNKLFEDIELKSKKSGGNNGLFYNNNLTIDNTKIMGIQCLNTVLMMYKMRDFQKIIDIPIKIIVCVRNPFDVISSMGMFYKKHNSIEFFKRILKNIYLGMNEYEYYVHYYESFVKNPYFNLEKILNFLEIKYDDGYLIHSASLVEKNKPERRYEKKWIYDDIKKIYMIIENNRIFDRYKWGKVL